MTLSQYGLETIAKFEGFRQDPYQDIAGVWTIGYGSTYCVCGKPITPDNKRIDQPTALFMLRRNATIYADCVNNVVTIALTQNKFDALVSLCYNIGVKNFSNSTLVKKLNAGDMQGAADQFTVWRLAGGKIVQGLVNRRASERALFLSESTFSPERGI